jgi:hypothetical protein
MTLILFKRKRIIRLILLLARRLQMAKESECCEKPSKVGGGAASGGVYGLAFLGALIYYLGHAETFWMGVLGVLKAIVWPAILIYKLLELLY